MNHIKPTNADWHTVEKLQSSMQLNLVTRAHLNKITQYEQNLIKAAVSDIFIKMSVK